MSVQPRIFTSAEIAEKIAKLIATFNDWAPETADADMDVICEGTESMTLD